MLLEKNVLISGGTGSGKTTLLNCLSGAIPQEQRVIVAAAAPFRRHGSTRYLLEVFDGFAIPLIIERREMVGRSIPLLKDFRMTVTTVLGTAEFFGGEKSARFGTRWG